MQLALMFRKWYRRARETGERTRLARQPPAISSAASTRARRGARRILVAMVESYVDGIFDLSFIY